MSNERVAQALSLWAQRKDHQVFAEVMRRAVVGELLLDSTGTSIADPAVGLQKGDTLTIGSHLDNTGRRLLVVFTDNHELTRYLEHPGASLVQPAAAVLQMAMDDYEGIVIDGRSDGAFIAYADEIRQQFDGDPSTAGRLASMTVEQSVPFDAFLAQLAATRVHLPFQVQRDEHGRETVVPLFTTGPDGASYAVIGTAPAEVWAWNSACGSQPVTLAEVARIALDAGQQGVVVNPAGPATVIGADRLRTIPG
ncbi:MAG: SseB family protein [Gordonia sp. (in: high G+C Gram-positive bacteria)]|uniref:SseB family protein n=1 Tax=Gordonia sp. (in: high G+C Gram-positive bacteria) TaxID=84139 RepID=UPI0039E54793